MPFGIGSINAIRTLFYVLLFMFSAVMIGLTAARLEYTTHLPPYDPLNHGVSFYDPIVAELLASACLTLLWSLFALHILWPGRMFEYGVFSSFLGEMVGLFILFVLWLVGAAISSTFWAQLGWCHEYRTCRILTALVAFAWIGWATILFLLFITILFAVLNRALFWQMHGRYDPRASTFNKGRA
ncbi:uncharacterized protein C8Q71DRAFT_553477 [Rhodofomes roseus]|uniref:MARVEL domain-containing protein n=1 Tax=Rhodofomes roseus TaxID=34475 RepID=A0ABQ8KHY5_9APHY|nr:uncharacterized protein C8Q71DRAFT_553477 [Rhodofomes roseus]KAH9837616.1 hypothetical protein C8Q71DRAFT_553477 [Rhodofomes roseus]